MGGGQGRRGKKLKQIRNSMCDIDVKERTTSTHKNAKENIVGQQIHTLRIFSGITDFLWMLHSSQSHAKKLTYMHILTMILMTEWSSIPKSTRVLLSLVILSSEKLFISVFILFHLHKIIHSFHEGKSSLVWLFQHPALSSKYCYVANRHFISRLSWCWCLMLPNCQN